LGSRGVTGLLAGLLLLALLPISSVHASAESIPINGRYSTYTIGLRVPAAPRWAHDIIMNASIAWNQAQLWYQESAGTPGNVYTLVEAADGRANINFAMPTAYSGIAVGWTDYKFAPSSKSTIISTQTYLDPTVFSVSQESNLTARQYALRLALHELGRVLGLGSVLDGHDIMDPRATPNRATEPVFLSVLDLYALTVLASGDAPTFVTLPSNVQNQHLEATNFITHGEAPIPTPEFNGSYGIIASMCALAAALYLRRRKH
jgi:hypothetical protein